MEKERETQWQGDDSFGPGWGNQTAEPEHHAEPSPLAADGALDGNPQDFEIRRSEAELASLLQAGDSFAARVREHMGVVGADGLHVGTVDKVRGAHIILTRSDAAAGGAHHAIPLAWIASIDDKVRLNLAAAEAMRQWRDEGRSRALFEREDAGSEGPHALNSAFSGTYSDKD
ncbi:MAG TPA: DUF2171 domain-containing protein [Allosphingosinicella sp.]|nr:DUF2171 domain-containing protein [Allosphingosinicella sp.]